MISAAIVPYYRPRGRGGSGREAACVVCVHDGARVLAREDITVGRLACHDHDRWPCAECLAKPREKGKLPCARIVGPAEVATVAGRVAELLQRTGAEAVSIEEATGEGVEAGRGRDIAEALAGWLGHLDVSVVAGGRGDIEARLHALGCPKEGAPSAVGGSASGLVKSPSSPTPNTTVAEGVCAPGPLPGLVCETTKREEPTPAAPLPATPKAARRVAGIDPGSRHVAVAVLEGEAAPFKLIASLELDIGRDVPLRAPKLIKPEGREPYYRTTRREVTDEDVDAMLRDVALFLAEHDVDEAAVEVAGYSYDGAGALLLRSNDIGGELRGWLRAAELPVARKASRVWRAAARKMAGLDPERGAEDATTERGHAEPRGLRECGAVEQMVGVVPEGGAVAHVTDRGREGSPALRAPLQPVDEAPPVQAAQGARVDDRFDGVPVLPRAPGGLSDPGTRARHSVLSYRAAVRALVPNLPPDASAHVVDAAGCALSLHAPPEPVEVPRARPPAGEARRRKGPSAAKLARRERELADAGCLGEVCRARGRRGHDPACPVKIAARAKVSASMRGNQNARKEAANVDGGVTDCG